MTADRPRVVTDPAVRFGAPNVRGVSTAAIAERVVAGEAVDAVAEDYVSTRHEVLLACWHEGIHGDRMYRKRWGRWAEAIQRRMMYPDRFDPAAEADPPTG